MKPQQAQHPAGAWRRERHIPFSAGPQNGFDYIAAGHIHRGGWRLMPHKATNGGKPGADRLQRLTGPHGCWMGTLGAAGADVCTPLRHCRILS